MPAAGCGNPPHMKDREPAIAFAVLKMTANELESERNRRIACAGEVLAP